MEGVKHETRRQIIGNFYRKNIKKGKAYTIDFFKALDVKNDQVYRTINHVDEGESHWQWKGGGALRKLSKQQGKGVVKAMENKNHQWGSLHHFSLKFLLWINFFNEFIVKNSFTYLFKRIYYE